MDDDTIRDCTRLDIAKWRYNPRMKLDDMTEAEKLVFASLVRLMVRLDGEFSRDEASVLQEAADELGSDEFWGLVEAAALRDNQDEDAVRDLAMTVERPEVREAIYGVLYGVALQDALGQSERELLEWLERAWNIGS